MVAQNSMEKTFSYKTIRNLDESIIGNWALDKNNELVVFVTG
jgi:hypothetical protein